MRKKTRLLITLMMMFSVLFCTHLSVSAAVNATQNGVDVTITTDKENYRKDENILLGITVKNTNSVSVENLSADVVLPDGIKLKDGALTSSVASLKAGETIELLSAVVSIEETTGGTINSNNTSNPPKTGDTKNIYILLTIFTISALCCIIAFKKRRKTTKILSLLLCVTMVLTMVPLNVLAAEKKEPSSISVDKTITVDEQEYTITSMVQINKVATNTKCTVFFDLNYEGGIGTIEQQIVEKGGCVTEPEYPKRDGYLLLGWYKDKSCEEYFDFDNTVVNSDMVLYAKWLDCLDETDTDKDGISDNLEEILGTNISNADTDGDGLSDYIEIELLGTNPTLVDTDKNGVNDGDEDFDNDSLTNKEEVKHGTDPTVADTDGDKLSDYEELVKYRTDPLRVDTDGDGVSDGKEIELGTDPLVAQSSFNINISADSNDEDVTPSVDIVLSGEQVETLRIDVVNNYTFFPETMPGYMGKAYDFIVDGQFSSATISFKFDASELETGVEPTICYFNEETQELEELATTINGNIASATVTHFSKYILIDRKAYNNSFTWTDVWDSNKSYTNAEIILVIDDSGSLGGDYSYNSSLGVFMGGKDPEHKRLEVARNFVDNANTKTKIGIVKFDGVIDNMTGELVECTPQGKETLKNLLQFTYKSSGDYNISGIFDSRGYTYMYGGIEKAIEQFSDNSSSTLKTIIVFNDGDAHDANLHNSVIKNALEDEIKIYTVGLGTSSSYFNNYLKPLATNTGGAFYLASDAAQLADIYKNISEKIDIETDSDADGIPDYYEDNMICFNGVKLALDKNNPDTDGDGLKDGEEIKLKYEYNVDRTQVKVTGKMISNPTKNDSDGDGLYDNEVRTANGRTVAPVDSDPLNANGPTGFWDNHVNEQKSGIISTRYSNDYGLEIPELSELIKKAIGINIPSNKVIADNIVRLIVQLRDVANEHEKIIRPVILFIKRYCDYNTQTVIGAYLLNFVYDEDKVAYHSKPDTWQRYFGYNDFYDDIFRIGSYMDNDYIEFSTDAKKYRLWLWKGDYWNLHSGAEIGLYTFSDDYSGTPHYDVIDFEVPMTLSLYYYYANDNIKNVFNWVPDAKQWWITGFSGQNPEFIKPDNNLMTITGTVDLSESTQLYFALKDKYNDRKNDHLSSGLDLIFDDTEHVVWINWYTGVNHWYIGANQLN